MYEKSVKEIRKKILLIIEKIHEKTSWEIVRNIKDIDIIIDDAPEFGESFGVIRTSKKIIFGEWLYKVEPKIVSNHFREFLTIRESFTFFIEDEILFGEIKILTNYIVNLLALSYLQMNDPEIARNVKFYPIQGRFFNPSQEIDSNLSYQISTLLDCINQGTTYTMIFNTFMSFVDKDSYEDIDFEELLADINRYLSNDPAEIAAPIKLKKNTTEVLEKLIESGFNASSIAIGEELGLNQSTIARQIAKISSKFYARWRLERNFYRLGLETYIIIIKFSPECEKHLDYISEEILKFKFVEQYFEGKNEEFLFQYTLLHCPDIISERIANQLNRYKETQIILDYEIKRIKDKIFRTAIINSKFKPTIDNFKKLLFGKIPIKKFILWNNEHHKNREREKFDEKDSHLLKFISIVNSRSISRYNLFGVHYTEYLEFIEENNIDPNNITEATNFLNRLQNLCLKADLFDYRFNISLTGTAASNLLVISIKETLENEKLKNFIEKITIFGWFLILEGIMDTYLIILGPTINHPISDILVFELNQLQMNYELFSVKNKVYRFVDYSKLYDYASKKFQLR